MSNIGTQLSNKLIVARSDGKWIINHPFAQIGGGLFAVTAKWCGYCHKLNDSVRQAFQMKRFTFFYLDGGDDNDVQTKKLLQKMNVSGFPTLFYIAQGGVLVPYNGSRSPKDLVKVFK